MIGFDYTSAEEWRDFIKGQIVPLHTLALEVVVLRRDIEQLVSGNLSDVTKNNKSVRQIFLGGVNEDGEYKPNSLAKLYKETLGIFINPKEWVAYCKQSEIDASEYINCTFFDTVFLQFINEIKENTGKLLAIFEIDTPEINERNVIEIIKTPEKIIDNIQKIYISLIHVLANYNYHTYFIINTKCIPRYYIEQAYPKLRTNFDRTAEILNLEPKFIPDLEKESRDYTLWGHKENGFADLVYKLNGTIWKYFGEEKYNVEIGEIIRAPIFGTIELSPDFKKQYFEKCDKTIPKNKFTDIWAFYFTKNNDVYIEMYTGDSRSFTNKGSTTIMELFKVVSPELFLGILNLTIANKPFLQYEIKKVGNVKSIYLRNWY